MRLGIDFGTCYSSAALLLDNTLKPIKEPLKHGYSFPSSIFLTPEGEMLVGFAAENRRLKDIQRYKNEFKRVLGSIDPIILGDRQLQPDELVTEVIVKLKTEADKVVTGRGEQSLSQAILTVPATYLSNKRQPMLQACDRAGFSQVQLLEEPVAAAIYYSNTAKIAEGDIVLVYDLGGGTFDVTLLQKQNSGYQIRGMPDGDPNCGGVDFDRFIFRELVKNCSEELRQKLIPKECRRERAFVFPMCRNLKHQLSEASEAEISIPLTMESFSLTRERFNELIDDLVSNTVACCDRLISSAELEWSQINRVLLVGGSCRIPYVREVIARKWGKTPSQIDDPELAVCLGAAIYGAELDVETPESYLQKGLAKIQAGDYQSAIAEFDQAIDLDSNYAPAYCHRGMARAQLQEDQAALEDYDLAIRLDRNYGEAYLHRGNLRRQSNDLKGAIEDYDHALFVNPDLTEAVEKKELVFDRLISFSQSQVTNSTVLVDETVQSDEEEVNLESDENQPTVRDNSASELEAQQYLTKAQELLRQGDYQKSILMLQDSIDLNPNCTETHNFLGVALRNQGLLDEAKVELGTALRLDPLNFDAHRNLGITLHKQGHLEEAIFEYQEAIRLDPYDYLSHNMLGIALHKQGHLEEAISEYQEVLKLKPNLNVARNRLETAETELKQRSSSSLEEEVVDIEPRQEKINVTKKQQSQPSNLLETTFFIGKILAKSFVDTTITQLTNSSATTQPPSDSQVDISSSDLKQQTQNWRCIKILEGHSGWFAGVKSIAFSPDGKILASGSDDETIILWQVSTGQEIRSLKDFAGVKSIAFSPDGEMLASANGSSVIGLWKVSTGQLICSLKSNSGLLQAESITFSPDGKLLASSDNYDNTVKFWQVNTRKLIGTFESDFGLVTSVAFSRDGQLLAVGGSTNLTSGYQDFKIEFWQVITGKERRIQSIRCHGDRIRSITFSPDGKFLASGSDDNTVVLWEVSTGKHLRTLTGHTNHVTSVAFSPDGKLLAIGSDDNIVVLREVSTGKHLRTLTGHTNHVTSVAFSPDGKLLASGSDDKTIKLWQRE